MGQCRCNINKVEYKFFLCEVKYDNQRISCNINKVEYK